MSHQCAIPNCRRYLGPDHATYTWRGEEVHFCHAWCFSTAFRTLVADPRAPQWVNA